MLAESNIPVHSTYLNLSSRIQDPPGFGSGSTMALANLHFSILNNKLNVEIF